METFTIGLATDSAYDDDFINLIEEIAHGRQLTTYKVQAYNLDETLHRLRKKDLQFLSLYDRASDTSPQFLELYSVLPQDRVKYFVNVDLQKRASDKSLMHSKFIAKGINIPKTIIVPELAREPTIELTEADLDILGRPFVIKPSVNTGSGCGVYLNGFSIADVEDKRYEYPDDKYLLQTKIYSGENNDRRFWFRVFYVCGTIIITWWDTHTHRYEIFSQADAEYVDVNHVREIMRKVYDVCGLDFFSTELTVNEENEMYAIDYVNEICDMRLQSIHYDGIPDNVVRKIAREIVKYIDKSLGKRTG